MRTWGRLGILVTALAVLCGVMFVLPRTGHSAYGHGGADTDSPVFASVYAAAVGTKLDNCATCHSGGSVTSGGKTTVYGSCQWCHVKYGLTPPHGDIMQTLNPYGTAYHDAGRNANALRSIEALDSDGDGYKNIDEIAALRYPGDPADDPTKIPAPYRVFTRQQLERMHQHSQFMLMNTSKSIDFYVRYSGVPVEDLLRGLMLSSATQIRAISPDGFAILHPFQPSTSPSIYHVNGVYPQATYYYTTTADIALNPTSGWCDYSSPAAAGRHDGDPIINAGGLRMLLGIKREGAYLTPGVLNSSNQLDGEGPFRVVPPQKTPGPPDQKSTASNPANPWPYNSNYDHNAGQSARTVTMIRVEPLPPGTTDINTLEAGWPYVDQNKIVVYGAVDPYYAVQDKLQALASAILATDQSHFRPLGKARLLLQIEIVRGMAAIKRYSLAISRLQNEVAPWLNGCAAGGAPDTNDLVRNCDSQKRFNWAINEIIVLMQLAP